MSAPYFHVQGHNCGDLTYNNIFLRAGTSGGQPYYLYSNQFDYNVYGPVAHYIFWVDNNDGTGTWYGGDTLGDPSSAEFASGTMSTGSNPNDATFTSIAGPGVDNSVWIQAGNGGVDPGPTFTQYTYASFSLYALAYNPYGWSGSQDNTFLGNYDDSHTILNGNVVFARRGGNGFIYADPYGNWVISHTSGGSAAYSGNSWGYGTPQQADWSYGQYQPMFAAVIDFSTMPNQIQMSGAATSQFNVVATQDGTYNEYPLWITGDNTIVFYMEDNGKWTAYDIANSVIGYELASLSPIGSWTPVAGSSNPSTAFVTTPTITVCQPGATRSPGVVPDVYTWFVEVCRFAWSPDQWLRCLPGDGGLAATGMSSPHTGRALTGDLFNFVVGTPDTYPRIYNGSSSPEGYLNGPTLDTVYQPYFANAQGGISPNTLYNYGVLRIDGNAAYLRIEGLWFEGSSGTEGLYVGNDSQSTTKVKGLQINNCMFTGHRNSIRIYGLTDTTVSFCGFMNVGDSAISYAADYSNVSWNAPHWPSYGGAYDPDVQVHHKIINCTMSGTTDTDSGMARMGSDISYGDSATGQAHVVMTNSIVSRVDTNNHTDGVGAYFKHALHGYQDWTAGGWYGNILFDYNLVEAGFLTTAGPVSDSYTFDVGGGSEAWEWTNLINIGPSTANTLQDRTADFRLKDGSAAINAGTNLHGDGYTRDALGNLLPSSGAWNLGAFPTYTPQDPGGGGGGNTSAPPGSPVTVAEY